MSKIFAVNICCCADRPSCKKTIFVQSNQSLEEITETNLFENADIKKVMSKNGCDSIGNIFEMNRDEYFSEYDTEYLIFL